MSKMHVEVVSTEQLIYSGEAEFLVAPALEGEIGVYPRHVPLLTRIKPGVLRMTVPGSKEEVLVAVSGGMLEVQPTHITVLADTAIRGEDLDEARANEAKRAAEESLQHATDDLSTAKAHAALAVAIAQLKALDYLKKRVH
ncbi:F0F1 ATP synthase subunit epsilon [Aquitalea sp. FJL05]|jgi:F-type H+-transporting ATPase subunit epsilon|uniref:ATP synthase epsilon chain n=3 Tax=Aquitalea TaxID=407217 RepID=A0A318JBJ3_9NEIS|nr:MULTISPECIES: F0F1 ATP synthase subunit epsilon [Aquitalea]MBV8679081.1 F0F1 ATP synthase subunit epsilon [Aquitalea sp.]MBA4707959.1 F0F1 ATP synthase subunit epsilon [Aquitalea magnusonii]PXX46041.1 F-type H+-transporting ATPase subunit epsilon [Aquitalea magnusonii]RMD00877.1 F0F1 ATP synthase subunit epsilon [Aquitalea palustris]RQO69188.1 F0F1 ATP synthase subunit epsilon [Aquitalea sp. FJL05]